MNNDNTQSPNLGLNTKEQVTDELYYTLGLLRDAIDSVNEIRESNLLSKPENKILHMALVEITEAEMFIEILNDMRTDTTID